MELLYESDDRFLKLVVEYDITKQNLIIQGEARYKQDEHTWAHTSEVHPKLLTKTTGFGVFKHSEDPVEYLENRKITHLYSCWTSKTTIALYRISDDDITYFRLMGLVVKPLSDAKIIF